MTEEESVETKVGTLTKSHEFWKNDGSVYIAAENMIFFVHRSHLQEKSAVLENMFAMPQPGDDVEGMSQNNPIVLHGASSRELEALLTWIYKVKHESDWNPYWVDMWILVGVLKLSHMWQIPDGTRFAVHYIEEQEHDMLVRLDLGRRYNIALWVKNAMTRLILERPLEEIDPAQAEFIGAKTYRIISLAQIKQAHVRNTIAFAAPLQHMVSPAADCTNHGKCKEACRQLWWNTVAKEMLHPDHPWPFSMAMFHLVNMTWPGMAVGCANKMLEGLRASQTFELHDKIVNGAFKAVCQDWGLNPKDVEFWADKEKTPTPADN